MGCCAQYFVRARNKQDKERGQHRQHPNDKLASLNPVELELDDNSSEQSESSQGETRAAEALESDPIWRFKPPRADLPSQAGSNLAAQQSLEEQDRPKPGKSSSCSVM